MSPRKKRVRKPALVSSAPAEVDHLTYFAFAAQEEVKPESQRATPIALMPLPDVLGGRYQLERLLGVGGMASVYRARDLLREQFGDPDPYVAIKVLNDDFAEYTDASTLLYSEFALTMRLHHPHVVRLHSFEVDTACQRAFITLELMRGMTLDQLLCERPLGLGQAEFRDTALPLLEALSYSHEHGVLHGDIKPSNVMLSEDGLRLFDFGLGVACVGPATGLPKLARERLFAWTPRYAALELLEGASLSPATDLYAAACVLYELLSGHHPYRRLDARQAQSQQLQRQLKPPALLPAYSWRALRTALALVESERRINTHELLEAFRSTASGGLSRWLKWRT